MSFLDRFPGGIVVLCYVPGSCYVYVVSPLFHILLLVFSCMFLLTIVIDNNCAFVIICCCIETTNDYICVYWIGMMIACDIPNTSQIGRRGLSFYELLHLCLSPPHINNYHAFHQHIESSCDQITYISIFHLILYTTHIIIIINPPNRLTSAITIVSHCVKVIIKN